MAGKRTIELQELAALTSELYLEVDKAGFPEAKKLKVQTLIDEIEGGIEIITDSIIAGCGLNADGSYTADDTTNNLKASDFAARGLTPSLDNADKILDELRHLTDFVNINYLTANL